MFGKIENNQNLNKKGIGLGLYICKMITNQFDGDIKVESEEGIGSIFTFTMELYDLLQVVEISYSKKSKKSSIYTENFIILNE